MIKYDEILIDIDILFSEEEKKYCRFIICNEEDLENINLENCCISTDKHFYAFCVFYVELSNEDKYVFSAVNRVITSIDKLKEELSDLHDKILDNFKYIRGKICVEIFFFQDNSRLKPLDIISQRIIYSNRKKKNKEKLIKDINLKTDFLGFLEKSMRIFFKDIMNIKYIILFFAFLHTWIYLHILSDLGIVPIIYMNNVSFFSYFLLGMLLIIILIFAGIYIFVTFFFSIFIPFIQSTFHNLSKLFRLDKYLEKYLGFPEDYKSSGFFLFRIYSYLLGLIFIGLSFFILISPIRYLFSETSGISKFLSTFDVNMRTTFISIFRKISSYPYFAKFDNRYVMIVGDRNNMVYLYELKDVLNFYINSLNNLKTPKKENFCKSIRALIKKKNNISEENMFTVLFILPLDIDFYPLRGISSKYLRLKPINRTEEIVLLNSIEFKKIKTYDNKNFIEEIARYCKPIYEKK